MVNVQMRMDEHTEQYLPVPADRGSIESLDQFSAIRLPRTTRKRNPGRATEAIFQRKLRLDDLERQTGFHVRFLTAILGGLALIAPMLIMAIHPIREKTLITASLSVFLFALGLAWKSSAQRNAKRYLLSLLLMRR